MIYAVRYKQQNLTRKEDAKRQKDLSRALLSHAVKIVSGNPPVYADLAYGPHGKPYFKTLPIHYNITHTNGLVCLAVHDREVGIDAETLRPYYEKRTDRVCAAEEKAAIEASPDQDLAFIKYWTLKESYVKYTGDGLGYGAKNAVFRYHGKHIEHVGSDVSIYQQVGEIEDILYIISVCSEGVFDHRLQMLSEEKLLEEAGSI